VEYASEVEAVLRDSHYGDFLTLMYGNKPARWRDDLVGAKRLRGIVNVLTRLRFCTSQDEMDFDTKEGAAAAPPGFMPWFDIPGRKTANATVAFGHWSTLGWLNRPDVLSLDTGCVWGGALSAVHLQPAPEASHPAFELIQVPCAQAQKPGL
jgi:bis(5'-nucleosyl)-tetraphosphatase (symmetrical)